MREEQGVGVGIEASGYYRMVTSAESLKTFFMINLQSKRGLIVPFTTCGDRSWLTRLSATQVPLSRVDLSALLATCHLPNLLLATCYIKITTCFLLYFPHATCYLLLATCQLPHLVLATRYPTPSLTLLHSFASLPYSPSFLPRHLCSAPRTLPLLPSLPSSHSPSFLLSYPLSPAHTPTFSHLG